LQGSVLAGARRPPNMRRQPEGRFPSLRLSAGCRFRKETIAGMRGNARDAPFLAVALRAEVIDRLLKHQNPLEKRNTLRSPSPLLVVGRRPENRAAILRSEIHRHGSP
jgi:hypothetical protein